MPCTKRTRRVPEASLTEVRCEMEADARLEARNVRPVTPEWSLCGLFCGSCDGALLFLFWVLAGIGRMLPRLAERPRISIAEDHRCNMDCVKIVQSAVAAFDGLRIAGKLGKLQPLWGCMIDSGAG
jgi:hypothetical protein